MKEYVIELDQEELDALYIGTGFISGSPDYGIRLYTHNIYSTIYYYTSDPFLFNCADGDIHSEMVSI